ncbi:MAG: NupC/NupG family nucleoside CNT transporter, partial [Sphingomonadales bacterium]
MPPILANLLGILAILLIAFVLSVGKRRIKPRVVLAAFALQALMAFLVLGTSGGRFVIKGMADGVAALLSYAGKGTEFLFGTENPLANTFALGALPVIVFFAALVSILYYLGIMQK